MYSVKRIPIVVTSGAAAVASEPIQTGSNKLAFQLVSMPAALVDLEGSMDGTNWVNLNYDNATGAYTLTALALIAAAGYYEVHERPAFVRMVVNIDAAAPQDYYAVLIVKVDLN